MAAHGAHAPKEVGSIPTLAIGNLVRLPYNSYNFI